MARSVLDVPGTVSENAAQVRRAVRKSAPTPAYWRPQTRGDCAKIGRPCPYLGCRYNMSLHISRSGGLRWQTELPEDDTNCALDIAERGSHSLKVIGAYLGVTREWARSGLLDGLAALRRHV